jgi:hypothetical protein
MFQDRNVPSKKKPQQQNFAKYAKDKKQSDAKSKVRISKSSNFYWLE